MLGVSRVLLAQHGVLRPMFDIAAGPPVLTEPGTYRVTAEKSRPFRGRFSMVLAVKVLEMVGSLVFRIGAAAETLTVVAELPTFSLMLKFAVCKTSNVKGGSVSVLNPLAWTVI